MSRDQLVQHIAADSLPQHLGGLLAVDHKEWLRHCLRTMANQVDGAERNCVEAFFAAANSAPNSPSSGESDNFDNLTDMESEDSRETVPEKHNNEDREKEVEFEKEDGMPTKRIQSELPDNVPPNKRSPESPAHTPDGSATPPRDEEPCAHPDAKHLKQMYEDSIHVPEPSAMTMEDFVKYCKQKRKKRLHSDYMTIKMEAPSGTFLEAK